MRSRLYQNVSDPRFRSTFQGTSLGFSQDAGFYSKPLVSRKAIALPLGYAVEQNDLPQRLAADLCGAMPVL